MRCFAASCSPLPVSVQPACCQRSRPGNYILSNDIIKISTSSCPSRRHVRRGSSTLGTAASAAGSATQAAAGSSPGPAVAIYWDLDNVPVQLAAHLPLMGRRLLLAVQQLALVPGHTPQHPTAGAGCTCQLTAYANERTLSNFAGGSSDSSGAAAAAQALSLVGAQLVPVRVRRNAADFAMKSDMHRFVLQHGTSSGSGSGSSDAAVLACVSNDKGFAPMLQFAVSRGCKAVAVTNPLKTRKRPAWAPPPDFSRYPLPAAASCCLVWDDGWLPGPEQQAEEAALVQQWAEVAGLLPGPLPCAGGVAAVWHPP